MGTAKGAIEVAGSAPTLIKQPAITVKPDNPVGQLSRTLQMALEHHKPLAKNPKTALCYILVEHYQKEVMPALVPCLGKLSKAGNAILGFDHFLSGAHKHYQGWLSEEQKTLNQLCHQIYRQAENLPGTLISPQKPIHPVRATTLLNLWRQAVGLLQHQPFVFHYVIYEMQELKGIPRKKRLTKIQVAAQSPRLRFQLSKGETDYTLDLFCQINGKWEVAFYSNLPFFICLDDHYYLLPSLKDAAIAQWMDELGGSLRIAPEDYPHFQTHVLSLLKQLYPVEEKRGKVF